MTRVTVEKYLDTANDYFRGFTQDDLFFSCELSAGYDSRTVGALLEHSRADFVYNTNTNQRDSMDHAVALEVAQAVNRPIHLFSHEKSDLPLATRVERCFTELEICRDVFAAVDTPRFFERKAAEFDVVMGGYGDELLRDKYSRFPSVHKLVESAYINVGIPLTPDAKAQYVDSLEK